MSTPAIAISVVIQKVAQQRKGSPKRQRGSPARERIGNRATARKKALGAAECATCLPSALAISREHFGDVPLEKIELKDERGWLHYKVVQGEGEEIRIDASTGETSSKYGMKMAAGEKTTFNWAKIVDDLHTGKLFGTVGMLLVDLTSGVIIALTLSGLYLWGVPLLRKRQSKARQAANPVPPRRPVNRESLLAKEPAAKESAVAELVE